MKSDIDFKLLTYCKNFEGISLSHQKLCADIEKFSLPLIKP